MSLIKKEKEKIVCFSFFFLKIFCVFVTAYECKNKNTNVAQFSKFFLIFIYYQQ
jgi:hypothetical protein